MPGLVPERLVGGDYGEVPGGRRVGQKPQDQLVRRLRLAEHDAHAVGLAVGRGPGRRRTVEHDRGLGPLTAAENRDGAGAGLPIRHTSGGEAKGMGQVVSVYEIGHRKTEGRCYYPLLGGTRIDEAGHKMSFAEKGAVGDIEPAFFIGYLHRLKATGTLKFEDSPVQRAIYFREGRVLFSSSNAPDDQLGAILVAAGKIGQEQFDALLARLEPKQSIAAALAQGGHVSQRDIGDAARRKVEQIVGACCVQATGSYEFEDGVLPKGALDLKLTTEKVLVSAFEVLEPSGFLSRILKSPMAVLAAADVEPADPELVRLKQALDGVSTLADIGGTVGLPLAATEARAAVLVAMGAASVVTSQIEEMALPDTGETYPALPALGLSAEDEPVEAQTIAFMESPVEAGAAPGTGADATLMMSPPDGLANDGSADATLITGTDLGVPAPKTAADSGAFRAGGGKRDKATTQDLEAIKELIASPAPARPGAASIPSQHWEPVLSSASRPGRESKGLAGALLNPKLRMAVGAFLLAGVVALGWIGYNASQERPLVPPPRVSTPPEVTLPSPGQIAVPAVGGQPTSQPFVVPPPTAASSPSPGSAPTVAPTVTPQPKPIAAATESPTKAQASGTTTPRPTPVQAQASPAVVKATPPVLPPKGSGYEALKAGRLAEAASGFESVAQSRRGDFSVQLLVACSAQTVEKAIQNDPSPELFILPTTIAGKPCHRLMRGFFKTNSEAIQAVSALPAYYVVEGAKPRAIPLQSVLR